jgi:hypothetical protein
VGNSGVICTRAKLKAPAFAEAFNLVILNHPIYKAVVAEIVRWNNILKLKAIDA